MLCGVGALLVLGTAAAYVHADTPTPPTAPAAPATTAPPAAVTPPNGGIAPGPTATVTPPSPTVTPAPAQPMPPMPIPRPQNPNMYPPPPPPPDQAEPQISQAALNAKGIHANLPSQIVVGGVAGRVNGVTITNEQLVQRFLRDGGQTTLNEMITGELVNQAAAKAHIKVTHAEIMAKYVEFKVEVLKNSPPGYTWTQILTAEGRSEEYALEQVRLRLLLEKLVSNRIPPVSLAGKIHIYHILIATVPLPPEHPVAHKDDEAKAKVEQIKADIDSGKITFKDAARKYSEDESTKSSGGDLGWVGHERNLDAKFSAAAFNLKQGQVSGPGQSQYGWHLIYLERLGENATPAELKKLHDDQLKQEATQLITAYVRELRDSATIEKPLMPGVPLPAPRMNPMQFAPESPGRSGPHTMPIMPPRPGIHAVPPATR